MADEIDSDPRDDEIQTRYPYPLAATFHRAYYSAPYLDEIYEYLLDLFEVTLKYLSSIALAQYFKDGAFNPRLNASLQNLQRPSLGHWQGWLRDILDLYRREHRTLLVPELGAFFVRKNSAELLQGYTALRGIMAARMGFEGGLKNPGAITNQQFFELMGEYRNRMAHGVRPSLYDKKEAARILMPAMRALFADLEFLSDYRLAYINEVQVDFADGDPNKYRFAHRITYLAGDRPKVSQKLHILESAPARAKELYLLDKSAEFVPLLSLHPFLIFRHCESCNTEQAFVLNQGKEKALDYISYQCTHHFSPTEYIDYMQALLSGIRVDPTALVAATDETTATIALPDAPAIEAPIMQSAVVREATPSAAPVSLNNGVGAVSTTQLATPSRAAALAPDALGAQTMPLPTPAPVAPPRRAATTGNPAARPLMIGLVGGLLLAVLVLLLVFVGPLRIDSATPGANPAPGANAIATGNAGQVTLLRELNGHSQWIDALAFAPDSATLASASSGDNSVRLWRVSDGAHLSTIVAPTVLGVGFMPGGATLMAATTQEIGFWNVADGSKARALPSGTAPFLSVALAPDGKAVAADSYSANGVINLWNAADGTLLHRLEGHKGNVEALVFSPDSTLLASGGADKVVRLWRVADGTLVRSFEGHSADVRALAFSPDGATLASGAEDNSVRLLAVAGDKPARVLDGHTDAVVSVAWSRDSQVVASGSRDHSIRLWRAADGNVLATLSGNADTVAALAFAPDGVTLASAGGDKTIRLWGLSR